MPQISVVMSVYGHPQRLPETIDSVLQQSCDDFEFIIVDDGSDDIEVDRILRDYAGRDTRIRLLRQANQGITVGLINACRHARGRYIARIDAGDRMTLDRLLVQRDMLVRQKETVLVTCRVEFFGPEWEFLWLSSEADTPVLAVDPNSVNCREGLSVDIPHHGSVMFKRWAYEESGGYRNAFFYGQDWDLWYRLADWGSFIGMVEIGYQARLFPQSLSMQNSSSQSAIAQCSLGAYCARRNGEDETPWLTRAFTIRPAAGKMNCSRRSTLEPGYYFIGEALRRNRDIRCRYYFRHALMARPWELRGWIRLGQCLCQKMQKNDL